MSIYQLHFFDDQGRRPTLDFAECQDDGAAMREAMRNLAQHLSCTGCEVYDGQRLVALVRRPAGEIGAAPAIHGAG